MRAFTLLEVLLAISLSSALAVFSLVIGVGALEYFMQRDGENTVTIAHSFARLESLHGICRHTQCSAGEAHGVTVLPTSVELFEGASYSSRWKEFDQSLFLSSIVRAEYPNTVFLPDGSVTHPAP